MGSAPFRPLGRRDRSMLSIVRGPGPEGTEWANQPSSFSDALLRAVADERQPGHCLPQPGWVVSDARAAWKICGVGAESRGLLGQQAWAKIGMRDRTKERQP